MAATRYIVVTGHQQGEEVSFPCKENKLSLDSLQSHFNRATGLKYTVKNNWVAVPLESNFFLLPEEDHLFLVVSGAIENARNVLCKPSLAMDLQTMFKPKSGFLKTTETDFQPRHVLHSRKAIRSSYRKKKTYTKTYKVVFIGESSLPVSFSRDLIVTDGFVNIDSSDSSDAIMKKLNDVLKNGDQTIEYSQLKILTYMAKTLSVPVIASGFLWTAENLKANVGQGKLYIMLLGYQILSNWSSPKSVAPCSTCTSDEDLPEINFSKRVPTSSLTPAAPDIEISITTETSADGIMASANTSFPATPYAEIVESTIGSFVTITEPLMTSTSCTNVLPDMSSTITTGSSVPLASPGVSFLMLNPMSSTLAPVDSQREFSLLNTREIPDRDMCFERDPTLTSTALASIENIVVGTTRGITASSSGTVLTTNLQGESIPFITHEAFDIPTDNQPNLTTTLTSHYDDMYLYTGSPEVTFHPRHKLSLRHRGRRVIQNFVPERAQNELVEIIDSEDEEIQKAIQASLLENEAIKTTTSSLETVLQEFQQKAVLQEERTKIIVFRKDILDSTIKALSRNFINLNARLYVKFSGEIGEDYGGPRREFFRLAIHMLHGSRYFEGPEGNKIFTHDLAMLEAGNYRIIGRLVALSLVQEGPGMHFLHGGLFEMMVGHKADLSDTSVFFPEGQFKSVIRQIEDMDTMDKRDKLLMNHGDWLLDQGFSNIYRITLENKEDYIYIIKKHHLYYRISGEITQFVDGMNDVHQSWDFVKANAEVLKPLFCKSQKELTTQDIQALFNICYSVEGSNAKAQEDETIYAWELFLQSIDDGEVPVSVSDLLTFITGADQIPPCGFGQSIDISFYNQDCVRLPYVSTCSLQLWLPRAANPETLSHLLLRSLMESAGFLKI